MPILAAPVNIDRLEPAAPPHTTGAGRFAIPVALMDGEYRLLTLNLVWDGPGAEQLQAALEAHLSGRGARPVPAAASPAGLQ